MTSLTSISNINWDNLVEEINIDRMHMESGVTSDFDLLVLSCTLYRLKTLDPTKKYLSLTDSDLHHYITTEDEMLAKKVHQHFSHKLVLLTLRGKELTKFRKDLNSFLNSNYFDKQNQKYKYPTPMLGLAYKLPYLYFYDMEIFYMFGGDYNNTVKGEPVVKGQKTLTYLRKIKTNVKNDNSFEYWFDDEHSNKVSIKVEEKNPLITLFDSLIKNPITVNGKFEARRKDSLHYYSTPIWNVVV
jgi:hypothetical protein